MKCITRSLSCLILATVASVAVACSGADGADGAMGLPGADGEAGVKGDPGAAGENGDKGDPGTAAATEGTLTGTVTDAVLKDPLADVTVTVKDSGGATLGTPVKTGADGKFSVKAPVGTVVLKLTKTYYTDSADIMVGVIAGTTVSIAATMSEAATGAPTVTLAWTGDDFGYGKTATLTATASSPTGSTLTYAWANNTATKIGSVAAGTDPKTATATLPTLADATKLRTEGGVETQYVSAYKLPDRLEVLSIVPDTRGAVSVGVTVTDGRGQKATASASLNAASIQTGLRNVALGQRVYLNSGHDGTNAWTLTTKPAGSTATLDGATTRTPSFVGDVKGKYTFTESTKTLDVYVGDWKGAITGGTGSTPETLAVTPASDCKVCHQGSMGPDQFTKWAKTDHAVMLAKGLTGANGTSYSGSCIGCHTVGYDVGVTNAGFDDTAKTATWTYPKGDYTPTNWATLSTSKPTVARLAGIQCENCHGPNDGDAHMSALAGGMWSSAAPKYPREYTNVRVSYSAELCATCHASGTGHHLYSEWNTTNAAGVGHSSRKGALDYGARAGSLNNHCGRCHAAQGYVQYAEQLKAGNPGNLAVSGTAAGVTADNVEPITCSACHDAHEKNNPNQLRFYGNTPMLASGFEVHGAGKGAQCMTCHNSRNGTYVLSGATKTYLHEDVETYNGGAPPGYSAPHMAAQTDVFAGRNAYFIGGTGTISKHASIEDTCVGCHMANNPSTHLSHGTANPNSHEFRIAEGKMGTLCANCHSKSVNGEGTQAQVEFLMEKLAAKMGEAVKAKINAEGAAKITVTAWDEVTDLYSAPIQIDPSVTPVTSVGHEEVHGQVGFILNFAAPMSIQFGSGTTAVTKSVSKFGFQLGTLKNGAGTTALFPLTGTLVKAGWNYYLIHGDGSHGIHNPSFAFQVLNATLAQTMN